MKVSEITVENLAFYLKLDHQNLTNEEIAELETFLDSAKSFIVSYTGLNLENLDDYNEFVIAIYVLCQDMYDTRSMYIDKSNLNKVVEAVLGFHHNNLL